MPSPLMFPSPANWEATDDLERLLLVNDLLAKHGGPAVADAFLSLQARLSGARWGGLSIHESLVRSLPTAQQQADFVHRSVMQQQGCHFGLVYAAALSHVRPGFVRQMLPSLESEWGQLHRARCDSSCETCDGNLVLQELFYLSDVSTIIVNTEATLLTPQWADEPLRAALLMLSLATAWTVHHSASRISGYQDIPPQNIQHLLEISDEAADRLDETFESWHMIAHAGAIRRAMANVTETHGYSIDDDELLDYP